MSINYQVNPNFATDVTGWWEEGATLTQVTDADFTPGTAMQIVAPSVNTGATMNHFEALSLPSLGTYTLRFEQQLQSGVADSWYVQAMAVNAANDILGGEVVTNDSFTPGASVAVYECTIAMDTANADALKIFIWKLGNTGSATLRISALELLAPVTGNPYARLRRQFQLRPY